MIMSKKRNLMIAVGVFLLSIVLIVVMEDTVDIEQKNEVGFAQPVSVSSQTVGVHTGVVKAFAEISPLWKIEIKSQVTGKVVNISPNAFAGESVEENEILLQVDDIAYRARLSDAERILSEAQLSFLQMEEKHKQAKADWVRSGIKASPSKLTLYEPQLNLSKQNVLSAQSGVAVIRKQLSYTRVKSPFSGVVTERFVNKGQIINEGDPLFNIVSRQDFEIAVSLGSVQWRNLEKEWTDKTAILKDEDQAVIASALIKRGGDFLDTETRQYKVFLEIENNSNILPGSFVSVELPGKHIPHTLSIPAGAYTRDGKVWYVDTENKLRFFESSVLFYNDDHLIVMAPDTFQEAAEIKVAVIPLASFVSGQDVVPQEAGGTP